MTQRRASTRLDLPQPFGPTTPVSPGSILNSVGSQKLLNPASRSRSNFIASLSFPSRLAAGQANHTRPRSTAEPSDQVRAALSLGKRSRREDARNG